MSPILLIVLLALWMLRSPGTRDLESQGPLGPAAGAVIFLAGYVVLITAVRIWSCRVIRPPRRARGMERIQRFMPIARNLIVVWLGIGIFGGLKWGLCVDHILGPLLDYPTADLSFELPQVLLGTLPALLTWMALWWALYPAERAMREQNLFAQLNENLPIHAPPSFSQVFRAKLRLQLLFTLLPVLAILAMYDLVVAVLALTGHTQSTTLAQGLMFPMAGLMFVFAPEFLRRIADSEPLPPGPLRTRLETLCRSAGLRYRQILLWNTNHSMSNAFVMGLFGRVRYVLLSDELLQTLHDDEIEAVFAHEMGHVVHHHLVWLAVVMLSVAGLMAGPLELLTGHIHISDDNHWAKGAMEVGQYGAAILVALLTLTWLSRRFERQADVFAARMLQRERDVRPQGPAASRHDLLAHSWVGEYGAGVFNSALRRVADVNNIPLKARDWLHPSIAKRIAYLQEMSADPLRTAAFDRFMRRTLALVLTALLIFGAWTIAQNRWGP